MTEPPEVHLKALWKGQQTETKPMSVDAIRMRAARHQKKVRWSFFALVALVVLEAVVFGRYAWKAPNDVARFGDLLVLAGLAWMLWRFRRRWPGALPQQVAPARTLLDFHRHELQRQRISFAEMMIAAGPVLVGVAVLGIGLHLARPGASAARLVPLAALIGLWVAAAWFVQRRQAKRLQRQIDEVDATPQG